MTVPKPGPRSARQGSDSYLGDRSTRRGGYWRWCRERSADGRCAVKAEIFKHLDAIEGQEQFLAKAMWDRMSRDATRGRLRFGERLDVADIQRAPHLLEMRLQVNPDSPVPAKRYLLRLYFAEPPAHQRLLLGLKFGRKPSAGDPDSVQDRHINEARYRYNDGMENSYSWGIELEC